MANIVLSILGNDKTGEATKSATANMTALEKVARGARAAALATAATVGVSVGAVLKTGYDEAKDASEGQAQLEAGLKSTGGAAGVTVQHMEDLASSIQNMSGQTDDSIVGAQKLLLTFTNIRNSGPNKIFDQATQAAADMAARMGGDASQNAVRLGKALNDPIKGVSALAKVGVSFDEGQKKQIASMVKAGDVAGAQKIILGELNKEFGGSAKAAGESLPGQLARAQRSFEDLSQGVVEALLPVMQAVLPDLIAGIKAVTPVLADVAKWIAQNSSLIPGFATALGVLVVVFGAMSLASAPITLTFAAIVVAIGLVVAAVVLLITHWNDIVGFFRGVWGGVVTWFQGTLAGIGQWWSDTWNGIVGFFRTVLAVVVQVFQNWTLAGIITSHWEQIVAGAKTAWGGLMTFLGGIPRAVIGFFAGIGRWLLDAGGDLLDGLISGAKSGLLTLGRWELTIGAKVIGWLADAGTWLLDTGSDILSGLASGARAGWSAVASFLSGIQRRILGALSDAGSFLLDIGRDLVAGLVGGLRGAWHLVTDAVHTLVNLIPAAARKLLGIASPSKVFIEIGNFLGQGFKKGIDGSRDDVVGAMRDLTDKLKDVPDKAFRSAGITRSALSAALADDTKALRQLAGQRDDVAKRLSAAQDRLDEARKTRDDYSASVSSGVTGLGAVTNAKAGTDADGNQLALSAADIISMKQSSLASATAFQGQIAQLKTLGLNANDYKAIVDQFQSSGDTSLAGALLSGGKAAVDEVNGLNTRLAKVADSLGDSTSNRLYQAGVDSAKKLRDGLQDQRDAVTGAIGVVEADLAKSLSKLGLDTSGLSRQAGRDIADGISVGLKDKKSALHDVFKDMADDWVATIKKKLKIKSPSGVFRDEIGAMIPAGIVEGITGGMPDVNRSVAALVGVPAAQSAGGSLFGGAPSGSAAPLVHIDQFNTTPNQSPADVAAELGWLVRGGL